MSSLAAVILIVGLGNPGGQYVLNRHNVGFMAADILAHDYNAGSESSKFSGLLRSATVDGKKVLLLKPQTYMNLSGESVQKAMQFYKIKPEHVIVIHDEIDLPAAEVRAKQGGGHAGHNGLRNIDQHIGKNYHRIRIGVGHPGNKDDVSNYVLQNFSKEEQNTWLPEVLADIPNVLEDVLDQINKD